MGKDNRNEETINYEMNSSILSVTGKNLLRSPISIEMLVI